jgi:signal transduction histidine kinase
VGEIREVTQPLLWMDSLASDRETYLFESQADTCFISRAGNKGSGPHRLGLDTAGQRVTLAAAEPWESLASQRPFETLLWVGFQFGQEWAGRILLLNPAQIGAVEDELHFLQDLIKQVGPAVYNVYLLRRLRMRAGAVERARVARELHDGAIQSLIAVEMQVDVLRRQSENKAPTLTSELSRVQGLLREEVLKLRELMQQMKSLDLDARRFIPFLSDTVERFERETGIRAGFRSDVSQPAISARMCREVARIVQEGLVNVRKHSHARQVLVTLHLKDGKLNVSIEDDGCGFPFSGRLSHAELDASGRGPVVIKERVRLVAGELTIESNPGKGARLEITVPQKQEAVYG